MHGVLHLGWVPDNAGRYRGQMAVLVKPTGLLGAAYMTVIRPFRHCSSTTVRVTRGPNFLRLAAAQE